MIIEYHWPGVREPGRCGHMSRHEKFKRFAARCPKCLSRDIMIDFPADDPMASREKSAASVFGDWAGEYDRICRKCHHRFRV
jgi:hypothetical protein